MLVIDPRVMLTKLGFGPTEAELRESESLGEEKWLAHQLAPGSDDGCDARIDAIHWKLKYQAPAPGANPAVAGSTPIGLMSMRIVQLPTSSARLSSTGRSLRKIFPDKSALFFGRPSALPRWCVPYTVRGN